MNPALVSHLWQSTWFALAAGLLTLFFRRNLARVRYALWLCASIKFLVPFAPLIDAARQLAPSAPAPAMMERVAISLAEPIVFGAITAAPAPAAAPAIAPMALPALWIAGFTAIALVRLRGWRRVRAALRTSRPVDLAAGVQVRLSPGLLEPGMVGVLRPALLVPDGIVDCLTPAQLASVLAHEVCHLRRRDNLAAAIHMTVEALFWFHPMVWWIGARMVEERERACDEGVVSLGADPRDYAEAILGVCKLYVESPLVCVSGVTGADLKKRIEAIMSNRIGGGLSFAKKVLLASAGVAALVVPAVLGVLIGAGHFPVLHAQQIPPPSAPPVQAAPTTQGRGSVTLPVPPQPAYGRLITALFDSSAMSPDELARAHDAAVKVVETQLRTGDTMSIMRVVQGKVAVLQDYTADQGALESAIARATADSDSSSVPREVVLEQAARILGAISGKKALIYFAGSPNQAGDQAAIRSAVEAAINANVAFYLIDVRGVPIPAASAVYTGAPAAATSLAQAFGGAATVAVTAGLPKRHAEMQTAPADSKQTLFIPLDGFSGKVDIVAEIRSLTGFGEGNVAANLRDFVTLPQGQYTPPPDPGYRSRFRLDAGSYIARVLLREQSTGRMFAESISFEVK
jgi:beta-lactamase regulating signal transducer with metallopeptidase domain